MHQTAFFLLGMRRRYPWQAGSSWEYASVHHHAPQQLASGLALHQEAANQLRGDDLSGAGEEALGEVLGGRGGGKRRFRVR